MNYLSEEMLSSFGQKFSAHSGIYELMENLGQALAAGGDISMMGGGNPAHIPAVEAVWRRRLQEIFAEKGAMESMLGDYDTPRGRPEFLETMANFFNHAFDWEIDSRNVAVTIGSQAANFLLFNMLGGERKILFPLVPEYIGYGDVGIGENLFHAWKPRIELIGDHLFKYRINFGEIDENVAAICLSRPTNPTANVITDEEIEHLAAIALERGIYLIIDNAYGQPFPNVVFKPVQPVWNDRVIHTFSLSKIGLPATRTGIVIAAPEIIRRIAVMNAALVLSTSSIGQTITRPLFASGEMVEMCERVVKPFYKARSEQTQAWIAETFDPSLPYRVHVCEGAFFLWLWFPGMPITDRQLYERLKARDVLIVPGSYFFPGLDEPWRHKQECIRLTYCANPEKVKRGIGIIAEGVKKAFASGVV